MDEFGRYQSDEGPPPMLHLSTFTTRRRKLKKDDGEKIDINNEYKEYREAYIEGELDRFYINNRDDEWFHERFNPNFQKNEELKDAKASAVEAISFYETMTSNEDLKIDENFLQKNISGCILDEETYYENYKDNSLCNCSGHVDRTIVIYYIPAICKRSEFIKYVTEALTKKNNIDIERIVISRPLFHRQTYFERTAWIILQDSTLLKKSLEIIGDITIPIFGPTTIDNMNPPLLQTFPLHYIERFNEENTPKFLPPYMNHPLRIKFDLKMVICLAKLLDELKKLPSKVRLESLLLFYESNVKDSNFNTKNMLDIAITYLRRVHHLVYYDGIRCVNEAHLLRSCSNLYLRPKDNDEEYNENDNNNNSITEDISIDDINKLKENDLDWNLIDDWIFDEIEILKFQILITNKQEEDIGEIEIEDDDNLNDWLMDYIEAQKIGRELILAEEDFVRRHTKLEPDDKARCSIGWCCKLFKNKEFLSKHIKTKHSDIMTNALSWVYDSELKSRFLKYPQSELPIPKIPVELSNGSIHMIPIDKIKDSVDGDDNYNDDNQKNNHNNNKKRDRSEMEGKRNNFFDPDAPKDVIPELEYNVPQIKKLKKLKFGKGKK